MATKMCFKINGHDYTKYIPEKSGLTWSRENTNDSDAGRDKSETMHTMVTSHQRKLSVTLCNIPFAKVQQLETDLQTHDGGIKVEYPDLKDGMCTRLFYNTSSEAGEERFTDNGVIVDNFKFSLISVKEDKV